MSDTGDPCEQFRAELADIEQGLAEARTTAQQAREILLHYRNLINKGASYTAQDREWIAEVLADSRTEQDAYANAPNPYDTLDNNRPLIGAAHHQSIELGKAHDQIRKLRTDQQSALRRLRECEQQNQQETQTSELSAEGESVANADCLLCGQPRVGHGHEGEPCRVHLGPDGVCQYHDIA